MNLLTLSWKNILHRPLNTLLSLILFGLGVGLVSFLLNVNHQVEANFNKNLAGIDLVVGAKGSPLQLILSSMYHVDNPTGNISLEKAKAFLNPAHPLISNAVPLSLGDNYRGYRIVGTSWDILNLYGGVLEEGRLWAGNMEVTIGAAVADALHLHVGDVFKSAHGLVEGIEEHDHDFVVVGILEPIGAVLDQLILTTTESIWISHESHGESAEQTGGDSASHSHNHDHAAEGHSHEVVAPIQYDSLTIRQFGEQQRSFLMGNTEEEITSILIKFRSRTNIQALNMGRNINENTDLMAASPPNEIARLQTNLGLGANALKWLAWVIVIVSGLSIFISLYSSLKDRQYELALLRVMGGSRSTLFTVIILEGLLLAMLGCLLGIALSHIGLGILSGMVESTYRYSFSGLIFLKSEFWLLLGALAVGFMASLLPALQARKTDISETLSKG
jgi:putative ABC transport system permease protein